jgi:hypothetical protein
MAGLGMRFVSIPMMINMAVAIITVKMKSVAGLSDFVELDEPLYGLAYFWLMLSGAGYVSVDYLIHSWLPSCRSRRRYDASPCSLARTHAAALSENQISRTCG